MGIFDMFRGSAAVKPAEAPKTELEPEEKRSEAEAPKLSVVEGEDANAPESVFWGKQVSVYAVDATERFQAANKFFREEAATRKKGLTPEAAKEVKASWDKTSPRYLSWMEATKQVDCAGRLQTEAVSLEKLKSELAALPEMAVLSPKERNSAEGYNHDEAMKSANERSRLISKIRTQEQILENLELQLAEHTLAMQKFDLEVAQDNKRLEVLSAFSEVEKAKAELDASKKASGEKAKGFFGAFRNLGLKFLDASILFRTPEQKAARAKLASAEKIDPDKLMREYYDRFAMGRTNAASIALERYRANQAQFESDMRSAARVGY